MKSTRRTVLTAALALPALTVVRPALAMTDAIYAEGGVAIDGTDAVAYFTEGKPVAGSSDHTFDWNGATWRFSSAANRDTFAADPEAYAPQYGGYCAWAVSEGYTASTVPDAWRIEEGKLYLNFSRRVQRRWERDIPGNIARADANWPGVLN
ncbi:MAG: YHS domain-containing (seleno)protein [Pseudomonadota bacterium]